MDHLENFLSLILPHLDGLNRSWEIFFVDDHSGDGSFDLITRLHKRDRRIRGCRLKENRGQQNALFCGLSSCSGEYIITMDDDGQHPISLLPDLLAELEKGWDVVYLVNREKRRHGILRFGTALTDLFFELFCGKPSSVEIGSYRILRRELVESFAEFPGRFVYISALIFRSHPKPRVCSMRYTPGGKAGLRDSRFSLGRRLKVFLLLFLYYGPFRGIVRGIDRVGGHGQKKPCEIKEVL